MTTPKLQMPELVVGQAGKELTHNQALAVLDQLAQPVVLDKDLTAPPGSPANGAMYIVAASATGAWAGQSGKLAYWLTSVAAWSFITPYDGWSVWVADEAARYERSAGVWSVVSGGAGFSYNRTNILGPVTQLAGVPTGAVIERGSNANGEYVRFADGTQICTYKYTFTGPINSAFGAVFNGSLVGAQNFPAAFAAGSIPSTSMWVTSITSGSPWMVGTSSAPTTDTQWGGFYVLNPLSIGTSITAIISMTAVGKWF